MNPEQHLALVEKEASARREVFRLADRMKQQRRQDEADTTQAEADSDNYKQAEEQYYMDAAQHEAEIQAEMQAQSDQAEAEAQRAHFSHVLLTTGFPSVPNDFS